MYTDICIYISLALVNYSVYYSTNLMIKINVASNTIPMKGPHCLINAYT